MTDICVCCKQPVDTGQGIKTNYGVVHVGYCHEIVTNQPLTEADGQKQEQPELLAETTLLL